MYNIPGSNNLQFPLTINPIPGATGGKGDKGDKGDAGGPGLTWRGIWAIGIQYQINDVVYRNGSSFVGLQDNFESEPTGFNSVWSFLAERGQDGQDWLILTYPAQIRIYGGI